MKEYISMMLIALCLCFVGCGDDTSKPEPAVTTAATAGVSETYGEDITETVEDAKDTAESETPETTAPIGENSTHTEITDGSSAYTTGEKTPDTKVTTGKKDPVSTKATTALTLPPILQTLPEGGVELPDDVWE